MHKDPDNDLYLKRTRLAYSWTRFSNTPFWALYTLLSFIMSKDLNATPFQIACVISIHPIMSLFSYYWSAQIQQRRDRLVSNIIWGGVFAHLPFLFVPFIDNPWFFVAASGVYMLFYRGVHPAWLEILKINVPEEARKKVFAYGSAINHLGGGGLAILMGWLMDDYFLIWKWLFPITACIAISAIFFQRRILIKEEVTSSTTRSHSPSFKERFQEPLKQAWLLMKDRPDFMRFQIGFMLGGSGLMLWKPALPYFFFEVLNLNYKELTIAITLCKSIGYCLALPIWTALMNRINLFSLSASVTALAALFPIGLLMAEQHLLWLYMAYILWGIMQAGSEMSWNLSGPIFSKHEESSIYTGVNVLTIGMRGCLAPPIGSMLAQVFSSSFVLLAGGGLCLLATAQMYYSRAKEEENYVYIPSQK